MVPENYCVVRIFLLFSLHRLTFRNSGTCWKKGLLFAMKTAHKEVGSEILCTDSRDMMIRLLMYLYKTKKIYDKAV